MRIPATKLRRPRIGYSVIDRSWLMEQFPLRTGGATAREPSTRPVTLLSAPAGAGKTTLMSSWAQRCADLGQCVAWVTLDVHDNDRALFWGAVLAAVRDSVNRRPETSAAPSAIDLSAEQLADRQPLVQLEALVAAADSTVWLFLDDLHKVRARDVLSDVEALLTTMPEGLRLVIATRRDPAVSVTRVKLTGSLLEIRAADLALDRGDARQLLDDHEVVLDESLLTVLMDRTEGWATGVRLAALALSRAQDPRAVVAGFAADQRAVADYLAAEVFTHLAPAELALLRACAVPEQLTPALAVALTGDRAVTTLLDSLHRDNVLVMQILDDGSWYRLHALLRTYLLAELQRTDPELMPVLHERCARWLATHGHVVSALQHAVSAGDPAVAREMLTGHGPTLLADGRALALRRTLNGASAAVLDEPGIRDLAALVELRVAHPQTATLPVRAPSNEDSSPAAVVGTALQALVTLEQAWRYDPQLSAGALAATEAASAGQPDDVVLLTRQSRGVLLIILGRLDEAQAEFEAAHELAVRSANDHAVLHAVTGFMAVASCRCDFRRASALTEQVLALSEQQGPGPTPVTVLVDLLRGQIAYESLDHVRARELLVQVIGDSEVVAEPTLRMWATGTLAELDVRTGRDPAAAARRLRESWSIAAGQPQSPFAVVGLAYAQHRCSWLVGRPEWAREAIAHVEERVGPGGELDVLIAAEHQARGRAAAARRRLAPILDEPAAYLMPTTLQRGLLIEAVLAEAAGEQARAQGALRRALLIGEETGGVHSFLAVPGAAPMLEHNSGRFGALDDLADRIRLVARQQFDHEHVPLTVKELELLRDLPAPLTYQQIAQRQQVSINTVKTHARSIYQKLQCGNRREAIAAARRRGML